MIDLPAQLALGLAMLSIGLAAIGIREAILTIRYHRSVKRRLANIERINRTD